MMNLRTERVKHATTAILPLVILAVAVADVRGQVTADDCFAPLEKGIYNKLNVHSRRQFSAEFREWLESTREERNVLHEKGGGEAEIGYGPFSFDGEGHYSLDRLDELDTRFQHDKDYIISEDEFFLLSQQTVDPVLIEGYYGCLARIAQAPSSVLRLEKIRGLTSDTTRAFKLIVSSDEGKPRSVMILRDKVEGGTFFGKPFKVGDRVKSEHELEFMLVRKKTSDGTLPEIRMAIYTDHGSVIHLVKAILPPAPPPKPKRPPIVRREKTISGQSLSFVRAMHTTHPNGKRGDPDSRCHLYMAAKVTLSFSPREVYATLEVTADERRHDWSYGRGSERTVLYTAPTGYRIISMSKPTRRVDTLSYAEKGAGGTGACDGHDVFSAGSSGASANGVVASWDCVGDTNGPELLGNCGCSARMDSITITLEKN